MLQKWCPACVGLPKVSKPHCRYDARRCPTLISSRFAASSQVKSNQIKSAPTPVGEPKAEKKKICMYIPSLMTVQPAGVSANTLQQAFE